MFGQASDDRTTVFFFPPTLVPENRIGVERFRLRYASGTTNPHTRQRSHPSAQKGTLQRAPLLPAYSGSDATYQVKPRTPNCSQLLSLGIIRIRTCMVRLLLGGRRLPNVSVIVGLNARVVGTIEDMLVVGSGWVSWGVLESN